MEDEIKEILQKFNEEVENVELIRNPFLNKNKKFKKILIYLEEEHCDIFKKALDYITNLQEENDNYKRRERKWEKWSTEKSILSSRMSEYLCKYQNVKREYAIQNKVIHNYKSRIDKATKELEKLLPLCIMPNNTLIHATEKSKVIEETIKILKGE